MKTLNMSGSTIYHVIFNEKHYYFGSVSAIYEFFTPEELKVSLSRLYSYKIIKGRPYKNKVCSIYRGVLIRKQKQSKK